MGRQRHRPRLSRHSFRRTAGRRPAMEAAPAGETLAGRARRHVLRAAMPAARRLAQIGLFRIFRRRPADERGLPDAQRLGAGGPGKRPAGHGLDLWRRLPGGGGLASGLQRHAAGRARRDRRVDELPRSAPWASSPIPSFSAGIGAARPGQLRPARSGRRPAVGEAQHPRLRRQSRQRHDLRPVRRRHERRAPDGLAAGARTVPPRRRREHGPSGQDGRAGRGGDAGQGVRPEARRRLARRPARQVGPGNSRRQDGDVPDRRRLVRCRPTPTRCSARAKRRRCRS